MKNLRQKLNDTVREWGNRKISTKKAHIGFEYGLGNFLTQDVTFGKVGAITGALVPSAVVYGIGSVVSPNEPVKNLVVAVCINFAYILPIFTGVYGYCIGKEIDDKLSNKNIQVAK